TRSLNVGLLSPQEVLFVSERECVTQHRSPQRWPSRKSVGRAGAQVHRRSNGSSLSLPRCLRLAWRYFWRTRFSISRSCRPERSLTKHCNGPAPQSDVLVESARCRPLNVAPLGRSGIEMTK